VLMQVGVGRAHLGDAGERQLAHQAGLVGVKSALRAATACGE